MRMFHVKNFEKFQHYKDRSPPWIKLYNEILDDYEFGLLPDASKMHLIAIWLLASRSENKIPFDSGWVSRRINATEKVNLSLLVERGFILLDQELQIAEQDASKVLAECLSREEERREEKKDICAVAKATRTDPDFEIFKKSYPRRSGANPWKPAEPLFEKAVKRGASAEMINRAAEAYAAECRRNGIIDTDKVAQAQTWLRQERYSDYLQMNGAAVNLGFDIRKHLG